MYIYIYICIYIYIYIRITQHESMVGWVGVFMLFETESLYVGLDALWLRVFDYIHQSDHTVQMC